jgi:hypothetical protein
MKPLVDDLYNSAYTQPESHTGRVVFALSVILVGYHVTFSRLIAPPFYAADARIAAFFALAVIVAARHRNSDAEVSIHDRQVDWIVGIPLVLLATAMNASAAGPPTRYWVHRVDLFSLPIFVAGITVLLFGLRALGRQRRAIALLFLAWPWPYDFAREHWFGGVAGAGAVTSLVVLGVAIFVVADGRPRDMWSELSGGASRERVAHAGHFRPPARGAVCCAIVAALVMAWLTQVSVP